MPPLLCLTSFCPCQLILVYKAPNYKAVKSQATFNEYTTRFLSHYGMCLSPCYLAQHLVLLMLEDRAGN